LNFLTQSATRSLDFFGPRSMQIATPSLPGSRSIGVAEAQCPYCGQPISRKEYREIQARIADCRRAAAPPTAMNRTIAMHGLRPVIDRTFPFAQAKEA
jgi:hypothetical protein